MMFLVDLQEGSRVWPRYPCKEEDNLWTRATFNSINHGSSGEPTKVKQYGGKKESDWSNMD
jgi:hypothetical protein